MSDLIKDPDLVFRGLKTMADARRKCEEAADVLIANTFGWWKWEDGRLCVFNEKSEPIATFHIETLQ